MWKIFLEVEETKEFLEIPFLKENPKIGFNNNLITFKNINGITSIIGDDIGLKQIQFSSFFPVKKYNWLPPSAKLSEECLNFFEKNKEKVMKIVITKEDNTILNILSKIKSFTYSDTSIGDTNYSLIFLEYNK